MLARIETTQDATAAHKILVKELLVVRGTRISIAELSRRSGVHVSTLFYVLRAIHRPTLDVGLRLADALEISPHDFLSWWKRMRALPRVKVKLQQGRLRGESASERYRRLMSGTKPSK
jgi:lambda repressor-like predicted transcriptional regulator